mgnify:CR=1 FL=1
MNALVRAAAVAVGVGGTHNAPLAAFTGVGGALSAIAVQFVSPDSFTLFLSISLLVGVVVGGLGTLWGAFFGAVFIMFVPSFAESVSKAAPWAVYGVVLDRSAGLALLVSSGVCLVMFAMTFGLKRRAS